MGDIWATGFQDTAHELKVAVALFPLLYEQRILGIFQSSFGPVCTGGPKVVLSFLSCLPSPALFQSL